MKFNNRLPEKIFITFTVIFSILVSSVTTFSDNIIQGSRVETNVTNFVGDPFNFLYDHLLINDDPEIPDLTSLNWEYFQERTILLKKLQTTMSNSSSTSPIGNNRRVYGLLKGSFEFPEGQIVPFNIFNIGQDEYTSLNWDNTYFDGTNSGVTAEIPYYYPGYAAQNFVGSKVKINPNKNDMKIIDENKNVIAQTATTGSFTLTTNQDFGISWGTPNDALGYRYNMSLNFSLNSTVFGPKLILKDEVKDGIYYQGDDIKSKIGDLVNLFQNPNIATNIDWVIEPSSDILGPQHGVISATGLNGKKTFINFLYTVLPNQTAVNVHDSTIYVGDQWTAQDNFDSAFDKDGNPVNFDQITVDDSQADLSKAGSFEVKYTYAGVTSTSKVTVKDNQTAVNVHDSTIYVGDQWTAQDNFDSAFDKDGNPVNFDQITVDDFQADLSKAGSFEVKYTYAGVTSTSKVTVHQRNSEGAITPTTPSNPEKPNASKNISNNTSDSVISDVHNSEGNDNNKVLDASLPDTGEENNFRFIVYGLGVIVGLLVFILYRWSRKNKE